MRSLRPAAGKDRDAELDVEPSKLLRDRVVLTLHIRDQSRRKRSLELLLTTLEVRKLGHMPPGRGEPISIGLRRRIAA
jgi:hypothetical protein